MNIKWPSYKKQHNILNLSEHTPENLNINFDDLSQKWETAKSTIESYKVDVAADITGNLPVANLGGGTGADATTFWRGDGAWVSAQGVNFVPRVDRGGFFLYSLGNATVLGSGADPPTMASPGGGPANANQADLRALSFITQAIAGSQANITSTSKTQVRGQYLPTLFVLMETGTDITDIRFQCGLTDVNLANSDAQGARKMAVFRYSTAVPDGGFVGVVADGVTQNVSATVAAIAASTRYLLKIQFVTATDIRFSVNDGTAIALTTNTPVGTQDLGFQWTFFSIAGSVRTHYFGRAECEWGLTSIG